MIFKIDELRCIVKLSNPAVIGKSESKLGNLKYALINVMHFTVIGTEKGEG